MTSPGRAVPTAPDEVDPTAAPATYANSDGTMTARESMTAGWQRIKGGDTGILPVLAGRDQRSHQVTNHRCILELVAAGPDCHVKTRQ